MTNVKVKDIADELNTKSKRIIEKLEEIKISGKGPMSRLTEDEIEKLYRYIGFIRPQKEEPAEAGQGEPGQVVMPKPAPQEKPPVIQHKGQYIIRRVESVVDTGAKDNSQKKDPKKRYIVSSDDSGLLQGYTTTKYKQRRPAVPIKEEKPVAEEKKIAAAPVKAVMPAPELAAIQEPSIEIPKAADTETRQQPDKIEVKKQEHIIPEKTITEKKIIKEAAAKPSVTAPPKQERPARRPDTAVKKAPGREETRDTRPVKPAQGKEERADIGTVIKPEKLQEKKPGKKIEMQKQTKKESAVETAKTKKTSRATDEIQEVDLKTTARLFSEEQVEKTGIADDKVLDFYSKASPEFRRRHKKAKAKKIVQREIQKPSIPSEIKIDETVTVKEFAEMIKKTAGSVIQKLMTLGVMATANEIIDFDTATLIADEYGVKTILKEVKTEEDILFDDDARDETNLKSRPPVVVVMGHVDHGKTSLLDAIKNTNVIDTEEGGITQHIGAYMVTVNGREITFLDTPGHEAFTSLRARGAQVTDIAIIVVAADDGVMPQTVEAINHAKSAKVNIIIAINKIDKPDANVEKVKQALTEYGLVPEEWGGDVICVPVSAKTSENLDELLEMVILSADMLDLKADPDSQAKGTVIDARLDRNRGVITTVIVQRGTLKLGDYVITGTTVGKIRAMNDYNGMTITSAGPSTPAEVVGMPEVPEAGELFYAIDDQKLAKQLVEKRKIKSREGQFKKHGVTSLEDFFSVIKEGEVRDLNLIIKADVQGSVEALKQSLTKLGNQEVAVKIIHDAVGNVTETDVSLAQVTGSIIIGFNIRPPASVLETAKKSNVDLRLYNIIYEAIEDVEDALKGMLAPKYREEILGRAEIRETFRVSGIGTVAGCYVTDGKIVRNAKIRLARNGVVVYTGELASLKRFKDDVREVSSGYECGTSIERFNDIKTGDIIEAYQMVAEERG